MISRRTASDLPENGLSWTQILHGIYPENCVGFFKRVGCDLLRICQGLIQRMVCDLCRELSAIYPENWTLSRGFL